VSKDWLPPREPRSHPAWLIASVLFHAIVIGLMVAYSGWTYGPRVSYIVLQGGPSSSGTREYVLPPLGPIRPLRPAGGQGRQGGQGGQGGHVGQVGQGGRQVQAPVAVPSAIPPAVPEGAVARAGAPGVDTAGAGAAAGPAAGVGAPGRRLLGARFGDGRLWVRPWDAIAAAVAGAGRDTIGAATHVALLDSAITARIHAFLDTLSPDSFATPSPPTWKTDINGQTWGIDGKWIYLGGLKLPTAVLALLPIPQGNYDAAKRDAELQRIREDILRAARRAEDAAQFRKYVEETRKRRDAEREAKKNQAIPPDSIKT
jgi:hypothetical protein